MWNVELSAPHPYQSVDELTDLLGSFRAEGYRLSLHNYFPPPKESFVLNLAAADQGDKEKGTALIEGALALCGAAGSPVYGIHAGYLAKAWATETGMFAFAEDDDPYEEALDRAVSFVNSIAPAFERQGVRFLLENLFPAKKRRHSLFCTFDEIEEFLSRVPDSVGLLLDLGHLNVSATLLGFDKHAFIDRYLDAFADRLCEVHISENRGEKDEHLALLPNSWQLAALYDIRAAGHNEKERIYCLEARNASFDELLANMASINSVVSA